MAVWLLPGQGAQAPGMGLGVLGDMEARAVFEAGSDVLGIDLVRLASSAQRPEVDDAFNAQALTMATTLACGTLLLRRGMRPSAVVGFSLGQIGALALSGMLSAEEAFALLKVRAGAMSEACREHPGAMLAVMGMELQDVQDIVDDSARGSVLVVANHNCPGQLVVSGSLDAIARCEEQVKLRKRKAVRLNTAGAFHSPLMHDAALQVAAACERMSFCEPQFPVICNTDAQPLSVGEAAKRLSLQVESPVLFEESVRSLLEGGEHDFVEVGFGKVLSGLMKRIDRTATCCRVDSLEAASAYYSACEEGE